MDLDLLRKLVELKGQGNRAVLATIVDTRGSTPRERGTTMVILADGSAIGTIGGGCGEAEVRRAALEVLESGMEALYTVDLTADFAEDEGMVCGGTMEVFLQPVRL